MDHDDGIGERFKLEWNGAIHELNVMPSRGRSSDTARGDDWPLTWVRERLLVDGHVVILGGPDYERFPDAAVWDTGQYRFEFRAGTVGLDDPSSWGLDTVMEIAGALISDEP